MSGAVSKSDLGTLSYRLPVLLHIKSYGANFTVAFVFSSYKRSKAKKIVSDTRVRHNSESAVYVYPMTTTSRQQ